MKRVAFYTLGCKVNQYDTQAMRERFLAAGYEEVPFTAAADVFVVNSCTVTAVSDQKSMKAVHAARRRNPAAAVVLAGCLAQRTTSVPDGVTLLIGTQDRSRVVEWLERALSTGRPTIATGDLDRTFEGLRVTANQGHTRAVMKIQEGCDRACSYCIIPSVRGPARSRPIEEIRGEARALAAAGYAEIVLTGIHLGSYGRDLPGAGLADAVDAVRQPGITRIRLGSLEPSMITDAFVSRLVAVPELCAHFHVPMQAGSDSVLRRMRRGYNAQQYLDSVARLRGAFPDAAITSDILVGFPGETEAEFGETVALARAARLTQMHVFPFSKRAGTEAAVLPGALDAQTLKDRAGKMSKIGEELENADWERRIGGVYEILIEADNRGFTREYRPVRVPECAPGQVVFARITGVSGGVGQGRECPGGWNRA